MAVNLTPSTRPHGAQQMLAATTLVCEAFVVFFATLAAHGLDPASRSGNWTAGLVLVAALALVPGAMKSGKAWPYWVGFALQAAMIAYGFVIPAMFAVGAVFALIYGVSVIKGHSMDLEKDEIDRQFHARERARGK